MNTSKPKRRWLQYSLRSLLVLMLLASIGMSWVAVKMREARREREAAAEIEKLGGKVYWGKSPLPRWLRSILGQQFLNHVRSVYLENFPITNEGMEHLKRMCRLETLFLMGPTVTNAALGHLRGMSQLQSLSLTFAGITDEGLEHLKNLAQLRELYLNDTQITDAGLEHLRGMRQLKWICLGNTMATEPAMDRLRQALPDCMVDG